MPVFYALGDTRTPVIVSGLDLLAFLGMAFWLGGTYGHVGISVAITVSSAVQMALLWRGVSATSPVAVPRRNRGFGGAYHRGLSRCWPYSGFWPCRSSVTWYKAPAMVRLLPGLVGTLVFGVVFGRGPDASKPRARRYCRSYSQAGGAMNPKWEIVSAEFIAGVAAPEQMTPPALAEVAFAGRSNVGKSSLLNKLMGRRNLVRAGATPGTTRQLNLFQIRAADSLEMVLVDLPGTGSRSAASTRRSQWGALIEGYLRQRVTLRGVVLLVDVRRGLEHEEHELIDFIRATEGRVTRRPLEVILVATKVDKILELQAQDRGAGHRAKPGAQSTGIFGRDRRGERRAPGRPFGTASSPRLISRLPPKTGVRPGICRFLPKRGLLLAMVPSGLRRSYVMMTCLAGLAIPPQALAQTAAPASSAPEFAVPGSSASASPGHADGAAAVKRKTPRTSKGMHRPNAPIATFPGFRLLPEGGSRVYVELTHAVTVEQHQSGTNLSFTLKGAEVLAKNNKNALVTTHFSTPMNRARLVPVKGDVELVIELRKPVNVTQQVVPGENGAARLEVDFPAGDFPADTAPLSAPSSPSSAVRASQKGRPSDCRAQAPATDVDEVSEGPLAPSNESTPPTP